MASSAASSARRGRKARSSVERRGARSSGLLALDETEAAWLDEQVKQGLDALRSAAVARAAALISTMGTPRRRAGAGQRGDVRQRAARVLTLVGETKNQGGCIKDPIVHPGVGLCCDCSAQGPEVEIDLTATEVISQGRTGTCWSFSTTSFLESEAFRITGELHDFSEMANVRVIYPG